MIKMGYVHLSVDDAAETTGLGYRLFNDASKRKKPKFIDGLTYVKSEFTIAELKENQQHGLLR